MTPRKHVGYLLPGFWDCHTHFSGLLSTDLRGFLDTHPATVGAVVARGFHDTLMAGFTSVRDVGSYAIEAHEAVKAGLIPGPNVYGAGGAIGMTGGHCDIQVVPGDYAYAHEGANPHNTWPGVSPIVLADGADECRRAVRQQIRRGAKCIKIATTGGVSSPMDDPEFRQFSDAEIEAFVDEAGLQGRSVAAHAHGKSGIIASIKAGVHTIEHGSYLDEEVAKLMRERGTMLVATRNAIEAGLTRLPLMRPEVAAKLVAIAKRHLQGYRTAVKYGVKIALGTDLGSSELGTLVSHGKNGAELVWAVKAGMTPLAAIEAATANAAETLGVLAPKKGIVREGWDADLIALDENPLENIQLFQDAENIKSIWKGGQLVKSPGSAQGTKASNEEAIGDWSVVEWDDRMPDKATSK
ncbi:hypothetical protein ACHAPT_011270 [Fusarium lateritium]